MSADSTEPVVVEDTSRGFRKLLIGALVVMLLVLAPLSSARVRVALLGALWRYGPAAGQPLMLDALSAEGAAALPTLIELQVTCPRDQEQLRPIVPVILETDPAALPALLRVLEDPPDEATRTCALGPAEGHLARLFTLSSGNPNILAGSLGEERGVFAVGLAKALAKARGQSRRRLLYLLRDLKIDDAPVRARLPDALATRPVTDIHDWPGRTVNAEWRLRVVSVATILTRLAALPGSPLVLDEGLLEDSDNGLDSERTLWPNVGLGQILAAVVDEPRGQSLIDDVLSNEGGRMTAFYFALEPEGERFRVIGPAAAARLWMDWAKRREAE